MSDDAKNTNDEKSNSSTKLDSMSQHELIQLVKNQIVAKKKLDTKINELTSWNVRLCQTEDQLRNELEDEQTKSRNLITELDLCKTNQSKLQQELNVLHESLECLQLQNESLKSSYKNLQDELSNRQNDKSNVALSLTNIEQDLSNELNETPKVVENLSEKQLFEEEKLRLKQLIESLELETHDLRSNSNAHNEQRQLMEHELSDLKSRINIYENEKQSMEVEINDLQLKLSTYDKEKLTMEDELKDLKSKQSMHDTEKQLMKEELNDLTSKLSTTDNERQTMEKELSDLRLKVNIDGKEKQLMEEELNDLRSKLSIHDEEKQLVDGELNDLRSKLSAHDKEKQTMERELNDLRSKFSTDVKEKEEELNDLKSKLCIYHKERQQIEDHLNDLKSKSNTYDEEKQLTGEELNDLKSKLDALHKDKQTMEDEINNYRKQIENFETENNELKKTQHKLSELLTHKSNENFDEAFSQRVVTYLKQTAEEEQHLSKLLSDIPAFLDSFGITNNTIKDFSSPLSLESLLHLCTLLVERCKTSQNNDGSNDTSKDEDHLSIVQEDGYERYQLLIYRQNHSELKTLFEQLYTSMNKSNVSDDWQICLSKPIDQSANQYSRLEINNFKFISEQIENELIEVRSQLDQALQDNEEQRHKIDILNESLHSSEQLKERMTEQREKIDKLQNIIDYETIDKTKFDQLEKSYQELEKHYMLLEPIKSEFELLKEDLNTKHAQLQDQHDKYQNEITKLQSEIEQQKQLLDNANRDQNDQYASLSQQKQQLSDLLETTIEENKNLKENNRQLENDLKTNNQLLFEKTKQADDLDRQLQILNNEYQDLKIKFSQIKEERNKFINDISLLQEKIQNFETEKSEYLQTIDDLKHESKNNQSRFDQIMKNEEKICEEKCQVENKLRQTTEDLEQALEKARVDLESRKTEYFEQKQLILDNEQNQANNLLELERLQQENERLNQTINELTEKLQKQEIESNATIHDLHEKQQKMKVLLSRLKKEFHEKTQQHKQSLIDLELADYEKTIKTLKTSLTDKDKENQVLRDELANLKEQNLSSKREIESLEQQKLQTEEYVDKLKALLDTTKQELQDAKDLERQRYLNDDNVRTLIDKLQIELDNNKITTSELLSEKHQLIERLNNQSETSQRTINLLEQNLRIAKHDLDVAKQDYETLQDDFNNYKIRAQSVLKQQHQQQSIQREHMPSMAEKQTELEETIEKLKANLYEANNKIQLLKSENEMLQKGQDHLNEVQTKLINESRKREQELRKQHQIELDKMENECLRQTNSSHDMIKNVTAQNEALSTTYEVEKVTAIEANHERSISILQNHLQASKQEIEQLKSRLESLRQQNLDNDKEPCQFGVNNDNNKEDMSWTYFERQEGEGSESASVDQQSTDVAVKTLENVLFGDASNSRPSSTNLGKPRHILFEDVELERQRIEEELNKTKFRLLNTTELLNESELNNVRLSEQVSLLKDEIRRIERNMERTESISNLEYLKNIILKFFVLKSSHERLQLIPVLVTMLKLSPDEQAKLIRVAQQITSFENFSPNSESRTTQGTDNVNSNSSTWSSYLNIW